ncbi:hypothetical protein Tco_1184277 [Tanacetum coccineum]
MGLCHGSTINIRNSSALAAGAPRSLSQVGLKTCGMMPKMLGNYMMSGIPGCFQALLTHLNPYDFLSERVAKHWKANEVASVLNHQLKQFVIDGIKVVLSVANPGNHQLMNASRKEK